MDQAVKEKIENIIASKPVVIFMKGTPEFPMCGFSSKTCESLAMSGLNRNQLESFDVLQDESIRAGIKEFSNWPTIPQVYVKGQFVGGCDVIIKMFDKGDLQKLLGDLPGA